MQNKYCLPIITKSKEEVLKLIKENQDYDYYEIWLDYIESLDNDFIKHLINSFEKKLIFLFRRQELEPIKMRWDKKIEIFNLINNTDSLLDLDFSLQKEELEYLKESSLNISKIISYHNYEKTPDYRELSDIIKEVEEYNPAIVKVATMCNNDSDALSLMDLLQVLKGKGRQFIVIGMGGFGKITRIYGLLQGNALNFAPRNIENCSAPGQILKGDLEIIYKIFNK